MPSMMSARPSQANMFCQAPSKAASAAKRPHTAPSAVNRWTLAAARSEKRRGSVGIPLPHGGNQKRCLTEPRTVRSSSGLAAGTGSPAGWFSAAP